MKIQFDHVFCTLDDKDILEDVSITFESQGIYTFIGENGSGKSTFLSLLSGLLIPNSGSITIDDVPIDESLDYRQSLSYLTNDMYIESNDTLLSIIKRYKAFGKTNFQQKLFNTMVEDFKIDPTTKLSILSTGQKKIYFFIAHMAFQPKTIILDEYLDGVDVIHHKRFTKYLFQLCDTNQSKVFIVSHHAHDIYMLSDILYLIQNKQLKQLGNIEDITSQYSAIQVSADETILPLLKEAQIDVIHFEQFGKIATITYKEAAHADAFWNALELQYCEQTAIPIERVIEYEFIS